MKKNSLYTLILAGLILLALLGFYFLQPAKQIHLSLQKLDGTTFSLDEISHESKAVVFFVQGNGCPIVRKSLRSFEDLRLKTPDSQASFFLVNANPQDSAAEIQQEMNEYQIKAPLLKDSKQEFMKKMGITRTAHLLIFERQGWKLRYSGALDQSLNYEGRRGSTDHTLASDVLDSIMAGKSGDLLESEVKGCLIGTL